MNQFMDFSFVDLNNATLGMERLTEYLASLKNILKSKNYCVLFYFIIL